MSQFLQTVKENTSFLLVCLAVSAVLVGIAMVGQKFLAKDRHRLSSPRTIAFVAMFGAIAAALMLLELPLFFAPGFYKLDFSEIPVLICTFYLGPVAGVVCEFLKVVLKLLLKGTTTAFVGDFANFFVGCSFILPASMIYHAHKSRKSAIIGLTGGTLVMTVFGSLFNALYLLPAFSRLYNLPLDTIIGMGTAVNGHINSVSTLVLFAVVPFNIIKGVLVSILTVLLYKRIEQLLIHAEA